MNVLGHGSVGIGSMTGGTVQLGLTPQEAQALAKATGQELVRQLTSITDRLAQKIAAQQGGAQNQTSGHPSPPFDSSPPALPLALTVFASSVV